MIDYMSLSRKQWLDLSAIFYTRLKQELEMFSPADWERVTPYLGWRNRDVLAHMSSAISINFREVLDRALAGNPGAPSEFNTFARNAREVARSRNTPPADILREFWAGLDSILEIYREMSDKDWLKPAWFYVGRVNIRTLFLAQFGDNVFHERDLTLVTGRWNGLDPEVASPLIDWFLRELHPSQFRPHKATGLRATTAYRLTGAIAGEWTLDIADNACRVELRPAVRADVTIEAEAEELVKASQGRAAPLVGRLARLVDWVAGPNSHEDVTAAITGYASAIPAALLGRIHISGDRALANRVNNSFWHFWERSEQTRYNIGLDQTDSS
jgi:uncharacterized protein (TIGR03083 family)